MTALVPPPSLTQRLPHSYGIQGLSTVGNDASGEYLIQRPDSSSGSPGELMLGGGRTFGGETMPSVGAADDSVVDMAVVSYLQHALPKSLTLKPYAPSASPSNQSETDDRSLLLKAAWTGIWAGSRDGSPWVGPVPSYPPGLFLCAAYTGHGMPNATLCARAVVQMILEERKPSTGSLDERLTTLQQRLVEAGDLPKSYFISQERIDRARHLPDVLTQDKIGILGRGLPHDV
jgi:glycine/D-amino acid oxidase-like deaminating enzyme